MVARLTIPEIRAEDVRWKPNGPQFDQDALKLAALADHRGRRVTLDYLRAVGMGDPKNANPLTVGVIPRLTESLSVLYRVPATRRLKRGLDVVPDDDPDARTFAELSRRMCLDNVWQLVDAKRNLFRQCVVSFVESAERKSVQVRIVEPHSMYRMPTASAADTIEADQAVALLVRDAIRPEDQRYQLWQHEDDGTWRVWIVDGASSLAGVQPYGESGVVPFDEVPLLMVYDDLPAGQAYLPIPESRLDFALNVSALANDLAYLVKLEAHTIKAVKTDDPAGVPNQVGPDKVWKIPTDSDVQVLATSPHIADGALTIERMLSMLAMSESLPPDYFSATRTVHTGPALKAAERDLEARRQRQQPLAADDERRAFAKIRAIHNRFAREWGASELADDLTLSASFSRQWQPIDVKELQQAAGFDLAIGTESVIDYIQERYNCDRSAAIDIYAQVQADRAAYPVAQQQNPAALISGTNPALGKDGAAKVPGAFNPELATSTEGASLVDAVRMSGGKGDPMHSDPAAVMRLTGDAAPASSSADPSAPPAEPAANTALNGAQVTSAVEIVSAVASRKLPRESGIAMLIDFFNLEPARAERVMGPVGKTFFVSEPTPPSQPGLLPGATQPAAT